MQGIGDKDPRDLGTDYDCLAYRCGWVYVLLRLEFRCTSRQKGVWGLVARRVSYLGIAWVGDLGVIWRRSVLRFGLFVMTGVPVNGRWNLCLRLLDVESDCFRMMRGHDLQPGLIRWLLKGFEHGFRVCFKSDCEIRKILVRLLIDLQILFWDFCLISGWGRT